MKMNQLVDALKKWIRGRKEEAEKKEKKKGMISAISREIPKEKGIVASEKAVEEVHFPKDKLEHAGKVEEALKVFSKEKNKERGGQAMRVVPVYNMMILPNSTIYFQIDNFRTLAGKTVEEGDKLLLAVLHKNEVDTKALHKEEVYPVAVEGTIKEISQDGYAVVATGNRVSIEELSQEEGQPLVLKTTPLYDVEDLDQEEAGRKLNEIKEELKDLVGRFHAGKVMAGMIERHKSIQEVGCVLSPWLSINNEERYHVLQEDRLSVRTKMLEQIIYEYIEVTKVTTDARTQQQEDYQKLYKEQALQKQIDYLQKELDEMHPEKVSDLRKFELRIEEAGMNETAKKEATKILNRLKNEGTNGQEAGMLYDYLDFLTGLSWKKEEQKEIDLDEVEGFIRGSLRLKKG